MIAVITYDAPHRKTQDVISKLLYKGYKDLHLVVIPWVERKNFTPLYQHRPSKKNMVSIEDLAQIFNISYDRVDIENLNTYFFDKKFHHIVIAGAGLLPNALASNHKIINAHPGYLPNMKGLDALKWAIYEGQPIGITTHYISEKADEGELIDKKIIPIYFEDTFHSLAYRIYEEEIEMLANSISLIDDNKASFESLADDSYAAHRRMPHHKEIAMMERFNDLRKKSSKSFRDM